MLVIYLHRSQVGLLEVLREVCPDLVLAPENRYLRLCCLSRVSDPYGLSCRIHEDGLLDVTRADR
jgi:hypothetical protein